jgi:fimbrial isopeptide formation D2 family protein
MKRTITLIALIACLACTTAVHAQYIAVQDTNFGRWLSTHGYASCVTGSNATGWQFDTTCSSAQTAVTLDCSNYFIHDMSLLTYFPNLDSLLCDHNQIDSLPPLPASLSVLQCSQNKLTSIPALPQNLTSLKCYEDSLTGLPILPQSLLYLVCYSNHIAALPALPSNLLSLYAGDNQLSTITNLPLSLLDLEVAYNNLSGLPTLPAGLSFLNCGGNHISSLPALPGTLTQLACYNNLLTSLPPLPSSLFSLYCQSNQLSALPALPSGMFNLTCGNNPLYTLPSLPASLYDIDCSEDSLSALPPLPAGLVSLWCPYNHLTSLPAFPDSLTGLNCTNNPQLYCLPHIPAQVMSNFFIGGTGIRCLPNRFSAVQFDYDPSNMPLCDASSGCDFYYTIAGNVHNDSMATCDLDSLSPGRPIYNMKVQLKQNGQVLQQFYTFTSGEYSFDAPPLNNYTVEIDTTALPMILTCPASGVRPVSLTATDSIEPHQNFGMVCPATADYGAVLMYANRFRPSFTTPVLITGGSFAEILYGADCGIGMPGTITTTISGPASYVSPLLSALTPSSVSGQTLTYTVADLNTLRFGDLDIVLVTDSFATLGSSVCITTIISPSTPDARPSDDTITYCWPVINSHDPNHKDVSPSTYARSGDWLTYTIHFQNTGSDTAYYVSIKDTLSQYVDAASFKYIGSSHKPNISLRGNAMEFDFPKINLVDSATNAPLSEGWIQYKVKAKANLPLNTQIKNTAYIVFDYNPAIITNTALTTVDTVAHPLSIPTMSAGSRIALYPNPNAGTFTLTTSRSIGNSYIIYDMLGNIIKHDAITSDVQAIDMSGAAAGVYTLSVKGIQTSQPVRFVVVK